MNVLGYRESADNGLSFELLIDGEFLGKLVGGEEGGIPYWSIVEDLPSAGTDDGSERKIVCVCSCGEYGCGHTSCGMERAGDSIKLCEFAGDATKPGSVFVVSLKNYHGVVTAIVARAKMHQEMER